MLKLVLAIAVVAFAGSVSAQAPDGAAKTPTNVVLELKAGGTVLMRDARKDGDKLCGGVVRSDAPVGTAPAATCIAFRDVRAAEMANGRVLLRDAAGSALCAGLSHACLAKVPMRVIAKAAKAQQKN